MFRILFDGKPLTEVFGCDEKIIFPAVYETLIDAETLKQKLISQYPEIDSKLFTVFELVNYKTNRDIF